MKSLLTADNTALHRISLYLSKIELTCLLSDCIVGSVVRETGTVCGRIGHLESISVYWMRLDKAVI